jgi:ADP-ribose pyrophosphatase YjhB (NUDIX family)
LQVVPQGERLSRDYAVTVFVVHQGRVAMVYDDLSGAVAPPSGHIRPEELPGEAAVRVVLAQTGMPAELVTEPVPDWQSPLLPRPQGLMAEVITPSHEHICLVYFARPAAGFRPRLSQDLPHLRWFDETALGELQLPRQVSGWAERAIAECAPSS